MMVISKIFRKVDPTTKSVNYQKTACRKLASKKGGTYQETFKDGWPRVINMIIKFTDIAVTADLVHCGFTKISISFGRGQSPYGAYLYKCDVEHSTTCDPLENVASILS